MKAVDIIRQIGVWGLGCPDGCRCASFEVGAIQVHLSCHKSSHMLRVWSNHMDIGPAELQDVAVEVLRQLSNNASREYASEYSVRFCSYANDHDNKQNPEPGVFLYDGKCEYCHAKRSTQEYLCDECKVRPHVPARYPWDGALSAEMFLSSQVLTT